MYLFYYNYFKSNVYYLFKVKNFNLTFDETPIVLNQDLCGYYYDNPSDYLGTFVITEKLNTINDINYKINNIICKNLMFLTSEHPDLFNSFNIYSCVIKND